jgi:cobalt-zinc-cadmium efflux system outer membrane protein
MKAFSLTWCILLVASRSLFAQDTLSITLLQADSLLIARNLSMIVSRYEIDKAEARQVQAKLFSNPQLSTEWSLYNPGADRWLDVGSNGQKIIALQQVFRIAGQRKASIRLAEEQKRMSEWEYYELAQSLKYALHVSYYRYYFLHQAIVSVRSQLNLLKDLIEVYKAQYAKGNISLQELTRLNSTYFGINNQVNETQTELVSLQETLQIILSDDRIILPAPDTLDRIIPALPSITLPELTSRALHNRPELKIIKSQEAQNELNYSLQRKEAFPNVTAGGVYDQAGSYVNNYTALSVGIALPLFNRNQGKIREARIGIQQSKVLRQSKQEEIMREVEAAFHTVQLLQRQYASVGSDFETELDLLSEGLVSNYSKNNISLLEFTDLFEAYNSNIIQFNQLKADLNKSYEELNYAIGEDLAR